MVALIKDRVPNLIERLREIEGHDEKLDIQLKMIRQ